MSIIIRKAIISDYESIWKIIEDVISTGEIYVFSPYSNREKMLAYWCPVDAFTYVAETNGEIVGTYVLRDNRPDLGSHIVNGSYMVAKEYAGNRIGRQMAIDSFAEATKMGYRAIQFNYVISTNDRAVKLWQSLGFEIVGEVPEAFYHHRLGFVSVYIMYRKLI